MADKPVPKHKKMYAGSPRIEADESGKKVLKKGPTQAEKESAQVSDGTAGIPEHETHMQDLMQKHAAERLGLHHKHEKEHLELAHKTRTTGGGMVDKIEENEGE